MSISIGELAQARELTGSLLNELGLNTYLFEIEPGEDHWQVKVDCAMKTDGGWQSAVLPVTREILLASRKDATAHDTILNVWRAHLMACKLLQKS